MKRLLCFLFVMSFYPCAWAETAREENIGVACDSVVENEEKRGSKPLTSVSSMKSSGMYAFTGSHNGSEATIVYQCSKDAKVITSILIHIPVPSESLGTALIDAEIEAGRTNGYRVCFDRQISKDVSSDRAKRVVNMRRNESMAYTISLVPNLLGGSELGVGIRVALPSSSELTRQDNQEIPECGT